MSLSLLLAASETQVVHQLTRLQGLTEWWQWFVLLGGCAAVLTWVIWLYRRDSVELTRGVAWGLCLLRCAALAGVLFYFLDLEKREERKLVRPSRAIVLIDTSLSMGIQDGSNTSGNAAAATSPSRRIDQVVSELQGKDFLPRLRAAHDVAVYRFDQQSAPVEIATFARSESSTGAANEAGQQDTGAEVRDAQRIAIAAGVCAVVALLAGLYYLVARRPARSASAFKAGERDGDYSLLVSMVALVAAIIVLGVASLRHPELPLQTVVGLAPAPEGAATSARQDSPSAASPATAAAETKVNWEQELAPRGAETRLGDAILDILNRERGGPVAGVVVVTDGGRNAGAEPRDVTLLARAAGISVHTIGLGSADRPANVRIADLEVPPRVFPGDAFPILGYIQAFHLAGRTVTVDLLSTPDQPGKPAAEPTLEESRRVTLGQDGELTTVRFEATPGQPGPRSYTVRLTSPPGDSDDRDNARSATVQVVERKNRVLLFAGAANREYQFLRNLLFRDQETTVDVYLQSGAPGISQEADELLFEFPERAEELFNYDALVAFDPDWTQLSEESLQSLERWVAEKAGGLVLIAGPVETPKLASTRAADAKLAIVRGLYPVVFYSRGSASLGLSRTSSNTPWPLQFTRDGQSTEFLRLEDDPLENERAWGSYPGVFGFYAVKEPKPAAKVLAHFSDPATRSDGSLPVYLASQFYGAGRVVFQGSGEMWRLRQSSDAYFDRYYTKLIRWVSQGRLLRDSNRGLLLVDKERCLLGETVTVQGLLQDSQHEPLTQAEVTAVLIPPQGSRTNLVLRRVDDAARPGMYTAQFLAGLEGDYRLELSLPNASAEEVLRREVKVRIPALETERPERNDPLLKELAESTGGEYFVGFAAALNREPGRTPLATLLEPQDQTTYLPGTPDREFDRMLMTWLMTIICGALCLEWLIRRLHRLA